MASKFEETVKEKQTMNIYRHGDVIIRQVDEIKGTKRDNLVLAEGEVTGHAHRIIGGEAALYEFNEELYLEIQSKRAILTHEEHKALELPKGKYEIVIQREYQPEGWSYVAD